MQLPLDVYGIDTRIDTEMMKPPHIFLFHFEDLYNGRKPYIVTLKKYRRDIFSEYCTEIFKIFFLRYVI